MFRKILLIISISLLCATALVAQGSSTPATTEKPAEPTKKPAVFRPTKAQIEEVQKMLKEKKLYDGEADGKYNDPTRAGIKSFQKDNGLKDTGTLNRATLEKFGVELTANQKLIPVSPGSLASANDTSSSKPAKTAATKTGSGTMESTSTKAPAADKGKKPAPFRANADQIKSAQKMMKDGKMYAGEETGKLDDATRDSLKKYQEANGVKVTGTLNAATLEKMGIALTDAQKANVAAQTAYDSAKKN